VSLNDVVVRALDVFVNAKVDVNHVETKNYYFEGGKLERVFASASDDLKHVHVYGGTAVSSSYIGGIGVLPIAKKEGKHATSKH
jgi:hypothetical protein